MKKIFPVFFTLVTIHTKAQDTGKAALLVQEERKFAAMSASSSTRNAFLAFLSDDGILFKPWPVNGKKFWQEVAESNDKLVWQPVVAMVSDSGDLGFTTGPFQQYQNRTDEQPVGAGSYVSVWKKENGQWKVVLDICIGHPPGQKETEQFLNGTSTVSPAISALQAESDFIKSQNEDGWGAYNNIITGGTRIYRPMSTPFINESMHSKLFSDKDKKFIFENTGGSTATSGDLAYMYGKVKIEITKEGNVRTLNGNYLRIWKNESGNWKIAVDLVAVTR